MIDGEVLELLKRGVVALERIADHFAPIEAHRERLPAKLSTATYSREERDKQALRQTLRGEKPQPEG